MTKKQKILDATLALIAENGLSGSPMSLIAKKAGVATGTIYHHFKSKEEIINAIYINKKKDFKVVLDKYEKCNMTVEEKFIGIWQDFYTYFIDNPLIFVFTQQISFSPIITAEVKAEGESYYASIFEFFDQEIKANNFIQMDVVVMTQLIFGNIMSLVELYLGGLEVTPNTIKDAISYSWRAIKI